MILSQPGFCKDINERGACLQSNYWACEDPSYTWIRDDCPKLCGNCIKEGSSSGDESNGFVLIKPVNSSGSTDICRDINEHGGCLKINDWACNVTAYPEYSWFRDDCPKICGNCPKGSPSGGVGMIQPVDCSWSTWSTWDTCSVTCGGGTKERIRTKNPAQHGGADCGGNDTENQICNANSCPGIELSLFLP